MPVHGYPSNRKRKKPGIRIRRVKHPIRGKVEPLGLDMDFREVRSNQRDEIEFQVVTGKPQRVAQEISQQLSRSFLDLSTIKVDVTNQQVTLQGRFTDKKILLKTLKELHSVGGVRRVGSQAKVRNSNYMSCGCELACEGPHGPGGGPDDV